MVRCKVMVDGGQYDRGWGVTTALRATLVLAMTGLAACSSLPNYANPVEWYRDLTGVSKNDDTGTERNAQNLAAGEKEPYPNLASVPPPPDRALSGADRQKLQEGLVADRTNAKYSDEELRAGRPVPAPAGTAPAPTAAENAAPASVVTPNAAPASGGPRQGAAAASPAPAESALTSPNVHSLPSGESPRAAPPPPSVATPSAAAAEDPPARQTAALPPDRPALAPAPAQSPAAAPRYGKGASVSLNVAEIGFSRGSAALSPDDEPRLAEVAALYRKNGGRVRIVGYGSRAHGGETAQQEMANFSEALDRANAVAQQLVKLGVPSARIAVEATPAGTGGGVGADTAEIFLEY